MLTLELIFYEFQSLSRGVALRSTTRWLLMLNVEVGGIIEIDYLLVSIVVQSVELLLSRAKHVVQSSRREKKSTSVEKLSELVKVKNYSMNLLTFLLYTAHKFCFLFLLFSHVVACKLKQIAPRHNT